MNFSKKSEEKIENTSQSAALPPLVSAEIDVSGLPSFMLNTQKLLASELMSKTTGEVLNGALRLWCMAWQQKPPASLPDDDEVLADFAHMRLNIFKKLKNKVMRGFVMCSDGRWYHPVLAEEAHQGHKHKLKRQRDVQRAKEWREKQGQDGNVTRNERVTEPQTVTRNERVTNAENADPVTHNVQGDRTRQDKEVERDTSEREVGGRSEKARATRWPADAVIPPEWQTAASAKRDELGLPPINIRQQAELFTNYWSAKSGQNATKIDWKRTWINWIINSKDDSNGRGRTPTRNDNILGAARDLLASIGGTDEGGEAGAVVDGTHRALPPV